MGAVGAHGEEFVSWEIPDIANRLRCCGLFSVMYPALADWAKGCRAASAFRKGKRSGAEQETAQQGSSTVSGILSVRSVNHPPGLYPMIVGLSEVIETRSRWR
jgi:hypothetical protein